MIYFIDFDSTICPEGAPMASCIRTIKKLKENNHTIVIYSCRSNPACVDDALESTNEMIQYLNDFGIPYDRVEFNKPYFHYIIDDRAVGVPLTARHHVDWDRIEKIV